MISLCRTARNFYAPIAGCIPFVGMWVWLYEAKRLNAELTLLIAKIRAHAGHRGGDIPEDVPGALPRMDQWYVEQLRSAPEELRAEYLAISRRGRLAAIGVTINSLVSAFFVRYRANWFEATYREEHGRDLLFQGILAFQYVVQGVCAGTIAFEAVPALRIFTQMASRLDQAAQVDEELAPLFPA